MSNAGVPTRVIQEISGHKSLSALQRYLDVKPDQIEAAIALFGLVYDLALGERVVDEADVVVRSFRLHAGKKIRVRDTF